MSETGFLVFNEAYAVGAELFYAVSLTLFFRPFLMERGHFRRNLVIVFLSYLFASRFCGWIAAPRGVLTVLMTALLAALSKTLELERKMAFLLGLLYCSAKMSSALIAQSLHFIGGRLWPGPAGPPEEVYLHTAVHLMLLLLSHVLLLAVMLVVLQRQLKKQRRPFDWRELCYISLIPTAGILFGQVIASLLFEIKDGIFLDLYERHPVLLAVVPLLALLFYAGAYLTIASQQGMAALQEEQASLYAEYQQTQAIRARIHEAEQFYTHIRQLKHEMRGHLTNIKGLARSGEYASLEDYIARMDESMSDFELTLQTGNPVTDVIVNDTRRRSLDLGIRFQVEFHYPEPGAYDAFDVGIILQNLLQNAVEACEEVNEGERFIVLTGKRKGRFFLIEVKNSFVGEVVFGQDGLPTTTKKEDVPMHGIGLSNVHWEAEKYMGEMEIKAENQTFSVVVLLQEKHIDKIF